MGVALSPINKAPITKSAVLVKTLVTRLPVLISQPFRYINIKPISSRIIEIAIAICIQLRWRTCSAKPPDDGNRGIKHAAIIAMTTYVAVTATIGLSDVGMRPAKFGALQRGCRGYLRKRPAF